MRSITHSRQFLIQADFATSANREALVTTSPRNIMLRSEIAKTFRDAVLEFSKIPSLQFEWMRYLPDDSVSGEFWTGLRPMIEELLRETRFLWSHSGRLDFIRNLRIVPEKYLDGNFNPLFSDLPLDEKYLSRGYENQLAKLRTLHLEDLSTKDLVDRVERDLNSANSNMKSATTDDEWHTQAARLLTSLLPQDRSRIKALELIPIIPLGKMEWTSATAGTIYYPDVDNISIPTDLGMKLLHPKAIRNPARKQLFGDLGVAPALPKLVRQRIFEKYRLPDVGPKASIARLRYFWWTHADHNKDEGKQVEHVYVYNQKEKPICPKARVEDIFFDTDDQYGVRELFFGDENLLLHPHYLQVPSPTEKSGQPSWKKWLSDFIGVQNYPPLTVRDDPLQLSSIFKKVAKDRPEMVVGLLEAHWGMYHESMNECIQKQISDIQVPCEGKDGMVIKGSLSETDLPTPALQRICKSFSVDEVFPFLKLPAPITESDHSKWSFLSAFGVTTKANLNFYLGVLEYYVERQQNHGLEKAFDLYGRIYFCCIQDEFCEKAKNKTR
jgi:hypothetical protein